MTGHRIRILSGTEEAAFIGRGLICDPTLRALRDFYVFDLGGGSLECLAFRERRVENAVSLQLGCVRLTERFVPVPAAPISTDAISQVKTHAAKILVSSGFNFALPRTASAVGTGGTMATARAILGERAGKTFEQTDARVSLTELRELLGALSAMTLDERREVRGLPSARADVFPVALATLVAVAEAGGLQCYYHSVYNLRYGLAAELLD
jgi:exopolyphosphatase/guanosine-5'-triphosphate,3'-diphosphate pyrophosphatase